MQNKIIKNSDERKHESKYVTGTNLLQQASTSYSVTTHLLQG